ncbi:MAG: MFS transporter [Anaerolineales bacterium]|nr:MFS transporter [Anaerolineales bacterium]
MTAEVMDTKARKRNHWAWYMYDFGNSAYAAVILLAVYSAYFKGSVVGGAEGSRLWGFSLGMAMLVVAVISPILGTIADYSAAKKRFLFVFSAISWLFTALLFFVESGDIFTGMSFFILAEIGYRGGQVFYNALLPDIATSEEMGRVSGNGWAIGSVGGIICLLFILPVIVLTKSNPLVVRGSFAFTAVFFVLSTLPLFLRLKERREGRALPPGENYLSLAFKRLKNTFGAVRDFREFIKFIVSFLIYNDGILMALDFAAIIGAVLYGMNQTQLIIFMIIVQVTSAIGAYVFGIWGEKTGFKQALIYSILLMIGTIVWMMFNTTLTGYFIIGALAGFALTGVQSLSRTITGLFAPENKATEFFGFFAVAGRSSSFIGPTIYGIIAFRTALFFEGQGMEVLLAEQAGQRAGIFSIAIFLIIGLLILVSVDEKSARKIAIEHAAAAAD